MIPPKWHMGVEQVISGMLLGFFWQLIPLAFMVLRR
jgi:hypothetical protein